MPEGNKMPRGFFSLMTYIPFMFSCHMRRKDCRSHFCFFGNLTWNWDLSKQTVWSETEDTCPILCHRDGSTGKYYGPKKGECDKVKIT